MAYYNQERIMNVQVNGLVNVDQEFSPTSENPQSGKAISKVVANALKGTVSGTDVCMKDISPIDHDIKVKLSGEGATGGGLEKGELIGTVAEVFDESIMNHIWQNEGELGSFSVYQNYVPVDSRTDLYVNIPAFSGDSAGLLVTNGTVYRSYRACSSEGGEAYCRIENSEIYISYNGADIINYGIEKGSKIIGVSCNGESFDGNKLTLYGCESGSGVKLYKGGKNLLPFPYHGRTNGQHTGFTFTDNGDGSITVNGQQNGAGHAYFDLMFEKTLFLPKGTYFISGSSIPITMVTNTNPAQYLTFTKPITLSNDVEIIRIYVGIDKSNTAFYENVTIKPMLEKGTVATEYEPYIEPTECVVNTDGTANVPSVYPTTRLFTDTDGVTIEAEYNRDVNKAFAELQQAVAQIQSLAVATIPND